MKIGIVSDIHSSPAALQAALNRLDRAAVDEVWCAGDIVLQYRFCPRTVGLLRARGARAIQGNHDAVFLSPAGTPARARLPHDDDLGWLGSLPARSATASWAFSPATDDSVISAYLSQEILPMGIAVTIKLIIVSATRSRSGNHKQTAPQSAGMLLHLVTGPLQQTAEGAARQGARELVGCRERLGSLDRHGRAMAFQGARTRPGDEQLGGAVLADVTLAELIRHEVPLRGHPSLGEGRR